MAGEWFLAYVEQVLPSRGDVIIMDNLPAYKGAAAIEARRLLCLAPYSPDCRSCSAGFSRTRCSGVQQQADAGMEREDLERVAIDQRVPG